MTVWKDRLDVFLEGMYLFKIGKTYHVYRVEEIFRIAVDDMMFNGFISAREVTKIIPFQLPPLIKYICKKENNI